ncbi:MAG TPA: thiamine pyrophosphate-dependent dehydrogenase E1 component subunit alpha [Gammaproteobacteria bacterium]|nr:thiamine pyrophosphate-dependent dehydrogenase E1 component subunit alpha [Gammaproteobacteria bacterium]
MTAAERDRELLNRMYLIRAFDEKVNELFGEGKLHGTAHFYVGQEAVAVGAIDALGERDLITSTHRGHGHAIAFGLDIDRMAAELLGRASGYCGGKGGSMHIADVDLGMLGANGIVGGSLALACGAVWGYGRLGQNDRVVISFFGDGGAQEGLFHESVNLAALWKLPVIFLCENNQYAMSLPVGNGVAGSVAGRAEGYGIPGHTVDGMDLEAVRDTVEKAREHALGGEGPVLIEALTYRYLGHSKSDAQRYRTREEVDEWRAQDAIERFAEKLRKRKAVRARDLTSLREDAYARVDEAFARAEAEPEPNPESALEDIYA